MGSARAVAAVLEIPIADLAHGKNARGHLGDVTELANSLRRLGQQQPIIVEPDGNGGWTVFDGNRRLAAARAAGLQHVLAIPRQTAMTDVQRVVRQLGMHATGRGFDPMAEARAVEWLMFADDGPHMDRDEIAGVLSKSSTWVKGRIDLLQLAPDEQDSVARGTMSVGLALNTIAQRRGGLNGRASGAPPTRLATPSGCDKGGRCGCICHKRNQAVGRG